MARFFVDELPKEGSEYSLTGENLDHAKVLRLKAGEAVTLCDGNGMECPCEVLVSPGLLSVGPSRPCLGEPAARIAVYFAFPKGDKAEHVIQKAVELGAAELVLFPSRYCVSRPDDRSLGKKLERWRKIARAAAEQSGRGVIPALRAADSYAAALAEAAQADAPILFYENEEQYSLHQALAEIPVGTVGTSIARPARPARPAPPAPPALPAPPARPVCPAPPRTSDACPYTQEEVGGLRVSLVTGSEGGFSQEEVQQARAAGFRVCTLGPRILRCETAPLVGLTAVMYALGEI